MKITWLTDVHLDFLMDHSLRYPSERVLSFMEETALEETDVYLFTGDISVASELLDHLDMAFDVLKRPVYFVLGNHDYYMGSIQGVRRKVSDICRHRPGQLTYLTSCGHVSLTKDTALVGHDGWYDGRNGDPFMSSIFMNDWRSIEEFRNVLYVADSREVGVLSIARKLSDSGANHVREHASIAAQTHRRVVIATHVPPFVEASLHNGRPSSVEGLPWYSSKSMGDAILDVGSEFPNVQFDVFCGHTHSAASVKVSSNVSCHVGKSQYGTPGVAGVIDVL